MRYQAALSRMTNWQPISRADANILNLTAEEVVDYNEQRLDPSKRPDVAGIVAGLADTKGVE